MPYTYKECKCKKPDWRGCARTQWGNVESALSYIGKKKDTTQHNIWLKKLRREFLKEREKGIDRNTLEGKIRAKGAEFLKEGEIDQVIEWNQVAVGDNTIDEDIKKLEDELIELQKDADKAQFDAREHFKDKQGRRNRDYDACKPSNIIKRADNHWVLE